jgi:hypothetical protein
MDHLKREFKLIPQISKVDKNYEIKISIFGCSVLIGLALFVLVTLYNDINSLYVEIQTDLDEFKGVANDAWRQMMDEGNPAMAAEMRRVRRQYEQPAAGAAGGGQQQQQQQPQAAKPQGGYQAVINPAGTEDRD